MHDLGSGAPPPVATTKDDSDVPLWALGLVIVLALALAASLAWAVIGADRAQPEAARYPDQWDRRVAPYVKKVERLRGLDFRHPLQVRFLSDKKFEKAVAAGLETQPEGRRAREIEELGDTLRSVGLLRDRLDVAGLIEEGSRVEQLAMYSYADERLLVRGKRPTPAAGAQVVHELTLALQDQHFATGDRFRSLAAAGGPDTTSASVLHAITEGDAQRVDARYASSLPPRTKRVIDAALAERMARTRRAFSRVPTAVGALFSTPFTLGVTMVDYVGRDHGKDVDELFRRPPTLDAALIDPIGYGSGSVTSRPVPVPTPGKGAEELGSGQLGALTWYALLADRVSRADAAEVAQNWGGDAYVTYRDGRRDCSQLRYAGGTPAATDRAFGVLQRWAAATPDVAGVTRDRGFVELRSCDPGGSPSLGVAGLDQDLIAVAGVTVMAVALVKEGLAPEPARCIADRLVGAYSVAQLASSTDDPAVQAQIARFAAECA